MKHNNSSSLFSFSLAYVVATVLFGLVLSIILSLAVAAQEGAAGQSAHARSDHHENRHKRLSPEERQAHKDAKFTEIDTNSDDMISQEEMAAADLSHPRGGKGGHFGRRHHSEKGGERDNDSASMGQHAEMQGRLFETMDSDSDGTLSKEEFAELHTATKKLMKQHMFQRMDKDEDGFLSRDEFPPRHRPQSED